MYESLEKKFQDTHTYTREEKKLLSAEIFKSFVSEPQLDKVGQHFLTDFP